MNGLDPASPCGLDLPGLKGTLPRRVAGSHLVFRGTDLLLVSRASGRELEIAVAPGDPVARELLAPFRNALTRAFDPAKAIDVETINGEPAARSPHLDAFADFSVTREAGAFGSAAATERPAEPRPTAGRENRSTDRRTGALVESRARRTSRRTREGEL